MYSLRANQAKNRAAQPQPLESVSNILNAKSNLLSQSASTNAS